MTIEFPEKFNMADYYLYDNLQKGRELKTCLYFEDESYTYGQAARLSDRAGGALRELGVRMEERVLISLPDCPEFVWTWFGANRIGAVITMVNPQLPGSDYEYYLKYTRATVAVIHSSMLDSFKEAAERSQFLKNVLVVGEDHGPFLSFKELTDGMSDNLVPADTHRDDVAIWLFTSGSTGRPKGAVHLQHDLPYNTEAYAKRVVGFAEDDITAAVPKLFFGYATGTNLLFPFAAGGATALFSERSTPETLFKVIERFRPTIFTTVPTMINGMLNSPAADDTDVSSLRICLSAGEALPVELYNRWMSRFGIEILDGIGSAEMFHIYISNRPGDVIPGSLGKIVEGYEAEIVDMKGAPVPTCEIGTLRIKGDSAALCYWNAHEKSKATFAGDWCITEDQFQVDEQGYYWYHGRRDDMLKVSGVFVAPSEIENCLLQHEAISDCAVFGHDAGQGLVKPKALVVLRDGHLPTADLEQSIKEFAKSKLAFYKYPRWVEFVQDLPRTDRGKLDRKLLRMRSSHQQ